MTERDGVFVELACRGDVVHGGTRHRMGARDHDDDGDRKVVR